MVHSRITFHELIKKVYQSIEIVCNVLHLELSFKPYEKIKVDPTLIIGDDDIISFVLDN